jgi:hypothetical protein
MQPSTMDREMYILPGKDDLLNIKGWEKLSNNIQRFLVVHFVATLKEHCERSEVKSKVCNFVMCNPFFSSIHKKYFHIRHYKFESNYDLN